MPRFALEAMTFGGMLLFTLWLLWARQGALDGVVPVLGAFAFAGLRLMPTTQVLFKDISQMRFGQAALEGLEADLTTLMKSSPEHSASEDERIPFERELRLEHVSYAYPGNDTPAVVDLDLSIQAGTTVGIVGATGAGKSTVIDLLLGLVPPSGGRFLVDGVPIGPENCQAWRHGVGFVPQAIHLVDDSLGANIAYGVPKDRIDRDRVREAARMASVEEFVESLPEGYETFIGEKGVRLSGGRGIGGGHPLDRDLAINEESVRNALEAIS